ncbi:MAG: C-terminal helicase domain-containing protein, partial [Pseudomonadota bacterium]
PLAVAATCVEMLNRQDLDPTVRRELSQIGSLASAGDTTRKAAALLDILARARANGEKTVVFSRFRRTLEYLSEKLLATGVPHAALRGGMSGAEKDAAVQSFAEKVPVLLASEVGGEGRNLQCASTLVNYDLPWNPMRLEQRIGRLHRIGQTREVHVVNLCAAGSIEERILDVLDRRINMFEMVVGELDMILGPIEEERDFGTRVLEIVGTARGDEDVTQGFERLGDDLEAARAAYGRTRELDRRLFEREFEA